MLYYVSYEWHEEYDPILLEGPKVGDWKEFCDKFIQDAAKNALAKAKEDQYLGWREITDELVEILETKGYKKITPIETTVEGIGIIGLAGKSCAGGREGEQGDLVGLSLMNKIEDHNFRTGKKIEQEDEITEINE